MESFFSSEDKKRWCVPHKKSTFQHSFHFEFMQSMGQCREQLSLTFFLYFFLSLSFLSFSSLFLSLSCIFFSLTESFFLPTSPMPWTINSEIFPLWCRGVCYSTTTSFNWLFNFLVSLTFLSLSKAATKQGAFWIYASFGAIGFVYFYFNLPETKGKSLEDTSRLFGNESRRPSVASVASRRKSSVARYGSGSQSIHSESGAHVSGLSSPKGQYNLGLQLD